MSDRRYNLPLDPATGFPAVDPYYYWKVESNPGGGIFRDIVGVSLYKQVEKKSWFSEKIKIKHKLIEWRWYPYDNLTPKESYEWLARGIWQNVLDSREVEAAKGTYPPKNLNN